MIHIPGSAVDAEWQDLAQKLSYGDGLNWPGDPDLWLGIGVIEDKRNRRTGKRLEVWRSCEDGTDQLVGHWHPAEQFRVLYDLCQMRAEAPGHVDVATRLEKSDAAAEEAAAQLWRENQFQALEHAAWLHVKAHEPANRHAIPVNPLSPKAPDAAE
jgi:hypothetical protein